MKINCIILRSLPYFIRIRSGLTAGLNHAGRSCLLCLGLSFSLITFSQSAGTTPGTENPEELIRDADNNIYKTIKLGNQVWMSENLQTTKFRDGSPVPYVSEKKTWAGLTGPGYCWYDNDVEAGKNIYGALYNWYAVNTDKLCPEGWHIPEDTEWAALERYLIPAGYDYEGITGGNKIAKSLASPSGWSSSKNPGAVGNTDYPEKRNATGFSVLAGGYRYNDGTFNGKGTHCCLWYATMYDVKSAWGRNLLYYYDSVHRGISSKKNGYSVRCLKD